MFWSKVFRTKTDLVVAICDEELIGRNIRVERGFKIKISKNFYGGEIVDEKQALNLMRRATVGNFFGEKIISLAEEHGFISKENIIFIKGIPHAQFVKLI